MSKKINFGTINAEVMNKLSAYHVAYTELKSLRSKYNSDKAELQKEEKKIMENRKIDLDAGLPSDEVTAKWSIEKVHAKMRALELEYNKACEPLNEAKREALKLLNNDLYYSYVLSMQKGDLSAKGKLVIQKKKSSEEYDLQKSFKGIICDFLDTIGCRNQDNATALDKFAQTMSIRTSGMVRNSKGEDYIKVKSASQFKEIFMLAFLQYTIVEKGVITVNDDGTLSMTVYENDDHSDNTIYVEWCKENNYEVCANSWKLFEAMINAM